MTNFQLLLDLFAKAPMKATFGMTLTYNEMGEAIFQMPYQEKFNHSLGDTHGGVIATLLDNAGWFTVAAHYQKWVVTADLQTRILEPAGRKNLIATGHIIRAGNTLAVAQMEVRLEDGKLIATASGSFMVTSKPVS